MPSSVIAADKYYYIDVSAPCTIKVALKDGKVLHLAVVTGVGDEVYFVHDPANTTVKHPVVENSRGLHPVDVPAPAPGSVKRRKVTLGSATIAYDEEGSRP